MEEGQGQGGLASSRQYGNALLGVRHQEEEEVPRSSESYYAVFTSNPELAYKYTIGPKCGPGTRTYAQWRGKLT